MMSPVVSVFMPTIRPYHWRSIWAQFKTSSVPFELICVGPVEPDFAMPDNMKFIYSEVKPAQCSYIGIRAATGKYIMNVADDDVFNYAFLDHIVKEAENCPNINNTIITATWTKHGQTFFGDGDESTPLLPICSLAVRELWDRYRIDKNFYGVYWDCDMAMMNYADGGTTIKCLKAQAYDFHEGGPNDAQRLCATKGIYDRSLFYSLWLTEFHSVAHTNASLQRTSPPRGSWIRKERGRPLDPIVDSDDILTVSQGVQ